jgi:hypothetical protein
MNHIRIILLCLAGLSLIALTSGLLFRYLSYCNSIHKVRTEKIDHQTCEWITDPPIWKHRINGLYYCPRCAPDPSPLSSDYFCPKCSHGFGKGEVFTKDF